MKNLWAITHSPKPPAGFGDGGAPKLSWVKTLPRQYRLPARISARRKSRYQPWKYTMQSGFKRMSHRSIFKTFGAAVQIQMFESLHFDRQSFFQKAPFNNSQASAGTASVTEQRL